MREAFLKKWIEPIYLVDGIGRRKERDGFYEETFTVPVTFLEFSHHYYKENYSRVAVVEMEDGTLDLIPLHLISFQKTSVESNSMIYLSVYHKGDGNGNGRFFDGTTSEMLFKFLNKGIQERFIKELKYTPEPTKEVYYCSSSGGNYFFSMKTGIDQCLILTSF